VQGTDLVGGSGSGVDSRVVLVGDPNLDKGDRTFTHYFNTAVVQAPSKANFGIGNAPKDPIRGPGTNNWDISLFKNFALAREGAVRLQYRLELYNAFNHTQFTGVDTTARFDLTKQPGDAGYQVNGTLGQYTSAANSRRIVMGLKLNF